MAARLIALFATSVLVACGPVSRQHDAQRPPIVLAGANPIAVNHHCADLIAQAQVQIAPVPGVWSCLEPAVQGRYSGTGDKAVVSPGFFLAPAILIGCDTSVCVYSLPLEATTAAIAGISETTMTIWLDSAGLVAYMAIPKPVR